MQETGMLKVKLNEDIDASSCYFFDNQDKVIIKKGTEAFHLTKKEEEKAQKELKRFVKTKNYNKIKETMVAVRFENSMDSPVVFVPLRSLKPAR